MAKTGWYIGGGIALAIVVITIVALSGSEPALATGVKLYNSPSCGCCGIYGGYADNSLEMKVVNMEDQTLATFKDEQGIPKELRSCHTMMVEGYFVEGHVPMEAIEKLLAERPDIKGIALPGMPSGTPGMPGPKREPWVIYAVNNDGSTSEFMTI